MGAPWGDPGGSPWALGGPLGGPSGLGLTYLSLCLSPGARGPGARRWRCQLRPRPNPHTRTRAAQPARSYFARHGPATPPRGVSSGPGGVPRGPRCVQRVWRRAPRCVQRVWRRAPRGASLSAPPPFCHGLVLLGLGLVVGTGSGSGRGGGNFPRTSFPYSLPDTTATTNGLPHTERIFINVAFGRGWY